MPNERPLDSILPFTGSEAESVLRYRGMTPSDLRDKTPEQIAAAQAEVDQVNAKMRDREDANRRIEAVKNLSAEIGARYGPSRCTLESYRADNAKQREALERLRLFDISRGLVLFGTVGTGKDHLLAAMLYRACKAGKKASWVSGPELFGTFRDGFDSGAREVSSLKAFTRPDVLGISDPVPQIGDASSWRVEILYRVIELRYRELKPTWLTINANSPADADAKLTAPVFDRLREDAELIPCFWPSFREEKKR